MTGESGRPCLVPSLDRDGVQVYPGVFELHEVDEIRASAYIALTEIEGGHNKLQRWEGSPGLLLWPAISNRVLNRYRTDQRLVEIVREHLGDEVKQVNNQVYYRLPGDGDSFAWHQDVIFRQPPEDFPGIEDAYLQTVIVIDEITEDNGAVEYIMGSHKQGTFEAQPDPRTGGLRGFRRIGLEGVKLTAQPGDVVAWSVLTVHGSEANTTRHPRMVYMNGFARADASVYNPHYLRDGRIERTVDVGAFK